MLVSRVQRYQGTYFSGLPFGRGPVQTQNAAGAGSCGSLSVNPGRLFPNGGISLAQIFQHLPPVMGYFLLPSNQGNSEILSD